MDSTPDSNTGPEPRTAFAELGLVLHVSDLAAASRFYQTLGFREMAAFPRSDGELTLVILNYGSSTLLLGRRDELHYENPARARKIRRGPHGLGVVVTLQVTSLDPLYLAVSGAGLPILLEPTEEFYGDRVFMFIDPYGYEWKISEPVREVTKEHVASVIAAS